MLSNIYLSGEACYSSCSHIYRFYIMLYMYTHMHMYMHVYIYIYIYILHGCVFREAARGSYGLNCYMDPHTDLLISL